MILIASCTKHENQSSELLFWSSNNPREISFCNQFTTQWNNQKKNFPVHLQPVPEGQSSEEVILAAVVGKTTPDIYANMWQGNVEMYAHAGVLVPFDTLKGFLEFIHERCDSTVIKEITSSDGHIYQIPWKVNPIMTIYNKDAFAENGITELPKTYSEFRKAAETFKDNNEKNNLLHRWYGYTEVKAIWYERLFNFLPLYLAASDGAPLIENNQAAFNNKYAVEVFAFLQSLYNNEYFARERLSTGSDPFVAQQIITKWTGPWDIQYLIGLADRHFDFDFYEPIVPDDHTGPVHTYADPKNIVIFNTCKNPEIAWNS
jgi:multiple sugar transport system substrate-binding protein